VVLIDGNNGCQNSQRLYCIETAPYTPPPLPSSDGCHVMFVTRFISIGRFSNNNNLTDRLGTIDAACNQEAAMFGTPLVKSRSSVGYVAWLSATVNHQQVFIWRGFCFVGCDDCFSFQTNAKDRVFGSLPSSGCLVRSDGIMLAANFSGALKFG
jgi:hypothetical protein